MAIEQLSFPTPRKEALYYYELTQNKLAHYHALTRLEESRLEKLLGYAGYWVISDEMHISLIAVDPPRRRQGLGELLLLNILFGSDDHEARLITLEVRSSNHAAQELYKKYRFDVVGLRRGYYRDNGEDAVLMTVIPGASADYQAFLRQRKEALYQKLAPTSR